MAKELTQTQRRSSGNIASGLKLSALTLTLLAACTLALWMWLADEGFRYIVDAGCIAGHEDASAIGYRFGADWKHGLVA